MNGSVEISSVAVVLLSRVPHHYADAYILFQLCNLGLIRKKFEIIGIIRLKNDNSILPFSRKSSIFANKYNKNLI